MKACVGYVIFFVCFNVSAAYGYGEHIKTLEASFTQRTVSQNSALIYRGKLYIKAPASVKWVYDTPIKKEIYIAGDQAMVYEPSLEQVSISRAKIDFLKILHTSKKQQDGSYVADFEGIRYMLTVTNGNNLPKQITFTDEFDNAVEITLHNVEINHKISDSVFVFMQPVGVDVVHN